MVLCENCLSPSDNSLVVSLMKRYLHISGSGTTRQHFLPKLCDHHFFANVFIVSLWLLLISFYTLSSESAKQNNHIP
jgi:hypothetical protein